MPLTSRERRSALSASFRKAKAGQKDNLTTAMEAQRPFEAQIEPAQTVCPPSSDLDAEPSPWSCLRTRDPARAQITKNCLEASRKVAAFIDKRLPGLFRLFSHGKERLPREARAAKGSTAPIPMIVQEEWAKMLADMHKQALVVSAILEKQNEELRKIGRAYKDEVREVGEEIGEK